MSLWLFLPISIAASCLSAALVVAYSKQVFASTSPGKRMNSLEVEVADLRSSMQTLLESHKRLRSRIGMQELRARSANSETAEGPPGRDATKEQLREYYLRGKNPQANHARKVMNGEVS